VRSSTEGSPHATLQSEFQRTVDAMEVNGKGEQKRAESFPQQLGKAAPRGLV